MIAGAAMPYVVLAAALGFMTWQMNASKAVSADGNGVLFMLATMMKPQPRPSATTRTSPAP